ncbi:MAG TPA: uracil-DNA glycosylase [Fervidobacterium sp.]|jgi:DNA polymerase|nr:uracil-DNA glycosylase [Fervidobacterium sp.]MBP8657869.1 uracil-DNA glycosylase [Fervidobacterium sp.]MBP9518471.1 uracil-DNA glycosylase [Fervidobacterium sp.]HCL98356.1 uracil-DNA glycosylase [Fervidobacterium sp.]HOK33272.1 uracil-DNA glycosylase [Fervidobacterium sp.]
MKKEDLMAVIEGRIAQCQMCPLGLLRKNTVPGEGNLYSPILFVGEGPGEEEDNQGRPFVGKAGQLLTKILESVNIAREDVYIANMVKCRPPNNRVPTSLEIQSCSQYLLAQIEVINPRMIVPLGSTALNFFLGEDQQITKVRGREFIWKGNIIIFPMFHPSYLLRNPSKEKGSPKDLTWQDIKKVRKYYDDFMHGDTQK